MEKLLRLLNEIHPGVDFENEEGLVSRHILNSFDIISIVMGIRDAYGVKIPAGAITPENFDCAARIYKIIQSGEKK